jgi:hypothetical protein
MRQPLCLLLHLRRRVGAPEASALDLVMCSLFNSSSNEAAQWVASALLACAALHAGGRVTLLCCLLACLECCYFFTCQPPCVLDDLYRLRAGLQLHSKDSCCSAQASCFHNPLTVSVPKG